jgi:hypothetical protein
VGVDEVQPMKKETARTLTLIVGVVILLAVLGLGSAAWLFTRSVEVGQVDEPTALREFEQVRARFGGIQPVMELRGEAATLLRRPPDTGPGTRLSSLRLLHWDPDDDSFTQVDLPFWLIRLKSGPIEIVSDDGILGQRNLGLTVEELERFGPTLVIDHEGRNGRRLLIWTE